MSEPERYDVEAMLKKLAKNSSNSRIKETVVRKNGEEAIRVQERRRRTNQGGKKSAQNSNVHVYQIVLLVVCLTVTGLLIGGILYYSNSLTFKNSLISKIESETAAKVELSRFRMNPLAARADSLSLKWNENDTFDSAAIRGIEAKIQAKSFLGNTFGGEEFLATNAEARFRVSQTKENIQASGGSKESSFLSFSRYSIATFNLSFGNYGSLTKTQLSCYPKYTKNEAKTELRLYGGQFQFPQWPPLELERGLVSVRGNRFQINSLRLTPPQVDESSNLKSFLNLKSTNPLSLRDESIKLNATLEHLPLATLLGGDLALFLKGNVSTNDKLEKNLLIFDPRTPQNAALNVTVSGDKENKVTFSSFYFLRVLTNVFDNTWYREPKFGDKNTMQIERIGNLVSIKEIDLIQKHLLGIRGTLNRNVDGSISGKLKIGVPYSNLVDTENSQLIEMFSEKKDGFSWVEIEISGTAEKPQDDFVAVYKSFSVNQVKEIEPKYEEDQFQKLIFEN